MKNGFLAMLFSGMMVAGAAGCGSDSGASPMDQACDKLVSCQTLSTVLTGVTTAAECKKTASAKISQAPAEYRDLIDEMINECLKQTDCATFTLCAQQLLSTYTH
jgi:hypothetical protein